MKKNQNKIFYDYEADSYYNRNKDDILKLDALHDVPIRILELYKIKPKKVLEIGCANGYRLDFIEKKWISLKNFV